MDPKYNVQILNSCSFYFKKIEFQIRTKFRHLSQPANIGPYDVPRTPPFIIFRTSSNDCISSFWVRPHQTSWRRLDLTSQRRPIWCPRNVPRECSKGDLRMLWVICWMSLNFALFIYFCLNSFQYLEAYWEPSQTSNMERFCEND